MTETEIQKLFAYQYGLLNNNLVLPNITMKGSEGGNYEADLIYIIDVKVERLPWADKYWENGKVPDEALLAHGWSVSCYKCGKMVDIDTVVLIDTRGALCKECAGKDGK